MQRGDRKQLKTQVAEVGGWIDSARRVQDRRSQLLRQADDGFAAITAGSIQVRDNGQVAWRVLPLRTSHCDQLSAVAQLHRQQPLSDAQQQTIETLTGKVGPACVDVTPALSAKWLVTGRKKRERAEQSARFLREYVPWAQSAGIPDMVADLAHTEVPTPIGVRLSDALEDSVGLDARLATLGGPRQVMPASGVAPLADSVAVISQALRQEERAVAEVRTAAATAKKQQVQELLAAMSIDRLKDATQGRLPLGALKDAGIHTVLDVLHEGPWLANLPGIGAISAKRISGAAAALVQIAEDDTPVRVDPSNRTQHAADLLHKLARWDAARQHEVSTEDRALTQALASLAQIAGTDVAQYIVIAGTRQPSELAAAVERLTSAARKVHSVHDPVRDPWDDFLARPSDYHSMLDELGYLTGVNRDGCADLPDDLVEVIRAFTLDTTALSVSLRGYQRFGAAFALVQRKVIIGDEMGLGKTVEALAAMAHLKATGGEHFVVICPAAVVSNWVREVGAKSTLSAHRLHGPDRELAVQAWIEQGGVAVTTFETLNWAQSHLANVPELSCVVVDEAHYIKNPEAKRSQRSHRLIKASEHAILLTGTPMENRIGEFRELVGYLRPDLVVGGDELRPRQFRQQVAPAYLRRNQEEVLTELPELVEVDEWLPMSAEDVAAYRHEVAEGSFMSVRRAAMQSRRSEKVKRLIEIVEEAEESGRRVIVYSYFLDVLDLVASELPGKVFGPLKGSVPAARRQDMVDEFSAAQGGAVLVAQIQAGGVGLNVQAASVVVICEPQLKPTTEWQAIARAHRMGQLQSVQVHRLLSEDAVDQHIRSILERKAQLFDDFAKVSELAESAPEAFDITEAEIAREVIAAERKRLGIGEMAGVAP